MWCFIRNFSSNSSAQTCSFELSLWQAHHILMVGCDSYLSKRMISFRHMLPLRMFVCWLYIMLSHLSNPFQGKEGPIVWTYALQFLCKWRRKNGREGQREKKKQKFDFLGNGGILFRMVMGTSLTLNCFSYHVRWKLPELFYIWRKAFPV